MEKRISKGLNETLSSLMEKHKITIAQLSSNIGIPGATIHRMKTDPKHNPTLASLKPIAEFFHISTAQLIGEEPLDLEQASEYTKINKTNWNRVPVISWSDAINWKEILGNTNRVIPPFVTTDLEVSPFTFALLITEPLIDRFTQGSVIIVDPLKQPKPNDYVIANKTNANEASVKQLLSYDGQLYLKPLKPEFSATPITTPLNEEYVVIGVVVQIRFDFEK